MRWWWLAMCAWVSWCGGAATADSMAACVMINDGVVYDREVLCAMKAIIKKGAGVLLLVPEDVRPPSVWGKLGAISEDRVEEVTISYTVGSGAPLLMNAKVIVARGGRIVVLKQQVEEAQRALDIVRKKLVQEVERAEMRCDPKTQMEK